MDASLFSVYTKLLSKKKETTTEVQNLFKDFFNIDIPLEAITIKGNEVILNVSSSIRMKIKQNDFKAKLQEKGFLLK